MSKICHVGYTRSGDDFARLARVMEWSQQNSFPYPKKSVFVDLTDGQDFLTTEETYDMVVLHFVCRWRIEQLAHNISLLKHHGYSPNKSPLQVSPHSNWGNWCKRLVKTRARYIHLFGGMGEVSGSYIVDLEGYRREQLEDFAHREQSAEWWVFKKI